MNNELKRLAIREEDIDYKKLSEDIFLAVLIFKKKYATLYMFLKKVVANTISINIANNDQGDFVFNLMKGYNVSSFLKKMRN